jgi:hypothetical protein
MMEKHRWLCAVMAVVFALTGPLALLPAATPAAAQTSSMAGMSGEPVESKEPTAKHVAGAAVANVFYVPGKIIICSAGIVASTVVMLLTFGTAYREAGRVFDEGCGGEWGVSPEMASGKVPPRSDYD